MPAQADRDEKAKQIYQDLLNRIAASYWNDDFAAYARMIAVPHKVSSFGPTAYIKTQSDLRRLFDDIRTFQSVKAITEYHRICLAARFITEDEIEGAHETRLLSGAQTIERPYPVRSILRRFGKSWMVCESDNAIESDVGLGHILKRAANGQSN